MAKDTLQSLIITQKDVEKQAEKILNETNHTFMKKPHLFNGEIKEYSALIEDPNNPQPIVPKEEKKISTTVDERLKFTFKHFGRFIDLMAQKETTNCNAKADVIIGEHVVLKDMSGPALMNLEHKLTDLRKKAFEPAPTFSLADGWEPDLNTQGVYKKPAEKKFKTEKDIQFIKVVEPTEHHPAEVREKPINRIIGEWKTTNSTGMWPAKKKTEQMERLDQLIRAVKKAQVRANNIPVEKVRVAKKLFDFIETGTL